MLPDDTYSYVAEPPTSAELDAAQDSVLIWTTLQRAEDEARRREDDKVYALALYGMALGLLLFVAMLIMDRGLPW